MSDRYVLMRMPDDKVLMGKVRRYFHELLAGDPGGDVVFFEGSRYSTQAEYEEARDLYTRSMERAKRQAEALRSLQVDREIRMHAYDAEKARDDIREADDNG